jgi:cation-transporting ATPase 13A2
MIAENCIKNNLVKENVAVFPEKEIKKKKEETVTQVFSGKKSIDEESQNSISQNEQENEQKSESMNSSDGEQEEIESKASKKRRKQKAEKLQKKIKSFQKKKPKSVQSLLNIESQNLKQEIKEVYLAREKRIFNIFYTILSFLSCGVLNLLNIWSKNYIKKRFLYKRETKLESATTIVINDYTNEMKFIQIFQKKLFVNEKLELDTYIFKFNYQLYFWNETVGMFQNIQELYKNLNLEDFLEQCKNGLTEADTKLLQNTFGKNLLLIETTNILNKILNILSHPIVAFEVICLITLYSLNFKLYFITLLAFLSIKFILDVRSQIISEKNMQKKYLYQEKIMVIRRNEQNVPKKRIVDSSELVPGDLIEITNNLLVPADVLLIYGNCVVQDNFRPENNSTSTKVAIENNQKLQMSEIDNKNILYTGNKVLYTLNHIKEGCFGIVLNTGFDTQRGNSVRSLLIKKVSDFSYKKDAYVFYFFMTAFAVSISLIYIIYEKFYKVNTLNLHETVLKIFQIFLVLLKPAVPIALFASVNCSVQKLKKKDIVTNDRKKLFDMGKCNKMIIDKNVLVNSGSSSCGFLVCKYNDSEYKAFEKLITNSKKLIKNISKKPIIKKYVECFGLCNLVTKVGEDYFGDIEDINMLKESGFDLHYKLQEKGNIKRTLSPLDNQDNIFSEEYESLRYFEYQKNNKEYNSVIIKNKEEELFLYTKGEPFDVQNLCNKSTVAYNYSQTISKYSVKGYKCISLAFKKLQKGEENLSREELETDMTFIGFYLQKIEIKEGFPEEIEHLKNLNINLVTISNSSLYLAIASAQKSGVLDNTSSLLIGKTRMLNNVETLIWEKINIKKENVDDSLLKEKVEDFDINDELFLEGSCQLAMTGGAFKLVMQNSDENQKQIIINKCKILGNLKKEDNITAIEAFQKFNNNNSPISYVHDGYGDIEISVLSNISICLKETQQANDASFYAKNSHLKNLSDIVQESRTTISNTHKNFEFVAYFTCLQFVGLLLLFSKSTNYAKSHIFFMDFIVLLIACYMQSNYTSSELKKEIPCRSIFNKRVLNKGIIMSTYGSLMMLGISWLLWQTKFYQSPTELSKDTKNLNSDLNYFYDPFVLFIFFVILNVRFIIFNNSTNLFKNNILKNWDFLLYIMLLLFSTFCLLFSSEFKNPVASSMFQKIFRIPNLHGFQYLIILFAFIAILGFFLIIHLEKKLFKRYFEEVKEKEEEIEIKDNDQSFEQSLVKESVKDSHLERKSRNTKKSKSKKVEQSKLSKKSDYISERNSKLTDSKFEKKRKPSKSKKRKNRRNED